VSGVLPRITRRLLGVRTDTSAAKLSANLQPQRDVSSLAPDSVSLDCVDSGYDGTARFVRALRRDASPAPYRAPNSATSRFSIPPILLVILRRAKKLQDPSGLLLNYELLQPHRCSIAKPHRRHCATSGSDNSETMLAVSLGAKLSSESTLLVRRVARGAHLVGQLHDAEGGTVRGNRSASRDTDSAARVIYLGGWSRGPISGWLMGGGCVKVKGSESAIRLTTAGLLSLTPHQNYQPRGAHGVVCKCGTPIFRQNVPVEGVAEAIARYMFTAPSIDMPGVSNL